MKRIFALLCLALLCCVPALSQKRRSAKSAKTPAAPAQEETAPASAPQDGTAIETTICKGAQLPEGYVTAGETTRDDCPSGAWIIKRRGTRRHIEEPRQSYSLPSAQQADPVESEEDGQTKLSGDALSGARAAMNALRHIRNAVRVGVTNNGYSAEVLSLKDTLDKVMPRIQAGPLRDEIISAYTEYLYASDVWYLMIKNDFDWLSAEGSGLGNQIMMKYHIEPIRDRAGQRMLTRQIILNAIWGEAYTHTSNVAALLNK